MVVTKTKMGDVVRIAGKKWLVVAVYPHHIRAKEIRGDDIPPKYESFNYGDLVIAGLESSGIEFIETPEERAMKYAC